MEVLPCFSRVPVPLGSPGYWGYVQASKRVLHITVFFFEFFSKIYRSIYVFIDFYSCASPPPSLISPSPPKSLTPTPMHPTPHYHSDTHIHTHPCHPTARPDSNQNTPPPRLYSNQKLTPTHATPPCIACHPHTTARPGGGRDPAPGQDRSPPLRDEGHDDAEPAHFAGEGPEPRADTLQLLMDGWNMVVGWGALCVCNF